MFSRLSGREFQDVGPAQANACQNVKYTQLTDSLVRCVQFHFYVHSGLYSSLSMRLCNCLRLFVCLLEDYSKSCGRSYVRFWHEVWALGRNNGLNFGIIYILIQIQDFFIFFYFYIWEIALLYYYSLCVRAIILATLVMSLISILCRSLTLRNKNSFAEGLNSVSTFYG